MLQTTGDALAEGVLFFTVYAFLGWIVECCYVRLRGGIWINRGFLHGPFVPVCGVGSLFLIYGLHRIGPGLPVRLPLACIAFSLLEYLTGWGLERLFQTRWWDYSGKRFNLDGRVCLLYSLYWGLLGIILVGVLQPVAAGLVYRLEKPRLYILVACLTVFLAVDTLYSVRRAMDYGRIMGELKLLGDRLCQNFDTQQAVYRQKLHEYERDRTLARQEWRRGIDEAKTVLSRHSPSGEDELRHKTEEANEVLRLALVQLKSTLARAADQRAAAAREYRLNLRLGVRQVLTPVLRKKNLRALLNAFPDSGPEGVSRRTDGLWDELKGLIHYRLDINGRNHIAEEESVMKKYICSVCGYIYDPEIGDPDGGIAPGTAFEDIPEDWCCPACGVAKDMFEAQ